MEKKENEIAETSQHTFKVLLIGDMSTGKSCLLKRFMDDSFSDKYDSTLGVDFMMKMVKVSGVSVKLQLWDTSGQERCV